MNLDELMYWPADIARHRLEMILAQDRYNVEEISSRRFEAVLGRKPMQDDLARCNCEKAGQPGHFSCGWDTINNVPFFMSTRLNIKTTLEHLHVKATHHHSREPKER